MRTKPKRIFGFLSIVVFTGVFLASAPLPSRDSMDIYSRKNCEIPVPGTDALSTAKGQTTVDVSQLQRQEKGANDMQPPDKVLVIAGVKPGMIIGEIGAGRGRYTVHLAGRVGPSGKVYANDIDAKAIAFLDERCRVSRIENVETVLGQVADPRFPKKDLDLIFMVWTYHMLDQPVDLLRSLAPYLKSGATVVMVEPIPSETEDEIKYYISKTGKRPDSIHSVSKESLAKDAAQAGFELVRMDSSLSKDNIFILRVKG